MAKSRYKTLDELHYLMRPLIPEERAALAAQLVRDGLREPISVWDRGADLVVLDGHNRLEICQEYELRVRHKVIEDINSLAQAEEWMINNQLGRRNITSNEKAFYIGLEYNRARGQGTRSDLSGEKADTAVRFGEKYNVSDRAIRDMGRFYEAVQMLDDTIDAKSRILHDNLPLSREEIIWIAELPEEEHRDIWARALASRKDLQEMMKKREKSRRPGGGRRSTARNAQPSAAEHFDIVELVRIIGANWPITVIEQIDLDDRQLGILEDHLDQAIQSLRRLLQLASVALAEKESPDGRRSGCCTSARK
jgi:hypothetical protein